MDMARNGHDMGRDMFNPDGDAIGTILIGVVDGSYYNGPSESPPSLPCLAIYRSSPLTPQARSPSSASSPSPSAAETASKPSPSPTPPPHTPNPPLTSPSDINLDTDDVSRHQCEIFAVTFDRDVSKAATIYVRDRQSRNGTAVIRKGVQCGISAENGVEPGAWLLERGVQVRFGRYLVEVIQRYKPAAPEGFLRYQVSEIEVSFVSLLYYISNYFLGVSFFYGVAPPCSPFRFEKGANAAQQFRDEFEITDIVLGTGGQGQVRLAYHVPTGKQVVVKIVDLVDIISKLGSEGARWARRVKQEADYLSKLDHVGFIPTSIGQREPCSPRRLAKCHQAGRPFLLKLHPVRPQRPPSQCPVH